MFVDQKPHSKVASFFSDYEAQTIPQKEIIIYAGEEPKGIFFLESGEVRQYDIANNGAEIVINSFKPPAFFPMNWAINKTPNRYFFETTKLSAVRMAPAKAVTDFVKANADVAYDLLSRVFSGTDGLLLRMSHLMGGDARSRLTFELIILAQRFGISGRGGVLELTMHEDDLATRTGLSRETVSRLMSEIRRSGLVAVDHKGIVIKNLNKLQDSLAENL